MEALSAGFSSSMLELIWKIGNNDIPVPDLCWRALDTLVQDEAADGKQ